MKTSFVLMVIVLLSAPLGFAAAKAEKKDDVIRLGDLKIRGQVRRPSIDLYQLKSLSDDQLKGIAELQFTEFEASLLESLEASASQGTP